MTTQIDYTALAELAKAAKGYEPWYTADELGDEPIDSMADAAYIAAASPDVVLGLIETLRVAQQEQADMSQRRIRAINFELDVSRAVDGEETYCDFADVKKIEALWEQLRVAQAEIEAQRSYKDGAYTERNKLVALLSKLFPAGKKKTAIEGWSEDWHGCVYIDLPTGQASWHYHDSQAALFDHLPEYQGAWDGHTTDEKYERIGSYLAAGAQPVAAQETAQ